MNVVLITDKANFRSKLNFLASAWSWLLCPPSLGLLHGQKTISINFKYQDKHGKANWKPTNEANWSLSANPLYGSGREERW